MTKPRRTRVYPGSVKPVHIGVYERKYEPGYWRFCFFDGTNWGCGDWYPLYAYLRRTELSPYQNFPWRGLTRSAT